MLSRQAANRGKPKITEGMVMRKSSFRFMMSLPNGKTQGATPSRNPLCTSLYMSAIAPLLVNGCATAACPASGLLARGTGYAKCIGCAGSRSSAQSQNAANSLKIRRIDTDIKSGKRSTGVGTGKLGTAGQSTAAHETNGFHQ